MSVSEVKKEQTASPRTLLDVQRDYGNVCAKLGFKVREADNYSEEANRRIMGFNTDIKVLKDALQALEKEANDSAKAQAATTLSAVPSATEPTSEAPQAVSNAQ